MDDLDVLARSLQYLTDSAKGLQDPLKRGFAMGIKIARLEDYRVTLERIMAAKWDNETASTWKRKGRDVCGNLVKEADAVLKRAKKREAAETRLCIIEAERDKLIVLADAVQDEAEERSWGELIDWGMRFYVIRKMC